MKPHFETYRYTSEACEVKSQSIVECRLSGSEISSILAVYARAVPTDCVCADGEIRYAGKVMLTLIYEDADKNVCRLERGAEFTHHADDPKITPSHTAVPVLSAENVSQRREGSGLFLSVIVGGKFTLFCEHQAEYLDGGDDLVLKRESQPIVKTAVCFGETETEDDFEIEYASDVLEHSENVIASFVETQAGQIVVSGEIALNLCALKAERTLGSYERLIPFRVEIPCDDATQKAPASATVSVKNATLSVITDEEKSKCKVEVVVALHVDAKIYLRDEIPACTDVYSTLFETTPSYEEKEMRYAIETGSFTERVGGVCSLGEPIDFSTTFQAALCPRAEIEYKKTEHGSEAEGAVFADVILSDKDGNLKPTRLSLPFVFPVNAPSDDVELQGIVCGLSVRQRKEGEAEAEATIKVAMRSYKTEKARYVSGVEEGKAFEKETCAFSVYTLQKEEGLWETAKRLNKTPEELKESNPNLEFPVKEGTKVFVYRQKKD